MSNLILLVLNHYLVLVTEMAYCDRCDRSFPHVGAIYQHLRDSSRHNECSKCELDFATRNGLKEHYVQSPRHSFCQYCDIHFDDEDELEMHFETTDDSCAKCQRHFTNDYGLHEHYRQSGDHHYCVECRRDFQSASNLVAHMNSSVHRRKDVVCPFGGCRQSFVSRSALILHLENGRCPSRVDKVTVDQYVRNLDTANTITDPSRMIAGSDSHHEHPVTTYSATEASWNGRVYECYLCHKGHRTLTSLNQHLASPRHQESLYFCPLTTCRVRFTTLSGLCQHIESQKCGVSKFREVQDVMDGFSSYMSSRLLMV